MKKKNLFLVVMLFATTFVCSCSKDDDDKTVTVDNEAPSTPAPKPGDKVEGTATVGDKTYTLTVGGTVADYVDLGLSVQWATHNIGASQPEGYGAYLAWGEVGAEEEGYVNGVKMKNGSPYYGFNNLKYSTSTSSTYYEYDKFTKYVSAGKYGTVDGKEVLEAMDDAATVNWGSEWRMPTKAEQDELRNNCTWEWVTTDVKDASGNYIEGYKVTGPNGNSIFLPAAGYRYDSSLGYVGSNGYYWSSSLDADNSGNAYVLNFNSNDVSYTYGIRCFGPSVRPVRSE